MQLISDGQYLSDLILKLLAKHEKVSFAFAWASSGTEVYRALKRNRDKISKGVFGTHFYQTDPQVLYDFVECENVRFMLQPSGVFHPKVIIFRSKRDWDVLIGSANLTNGAFTKNNELMLHVSSAQETTLKSDILESIKSYFNDAEKMTEGNAANYCNLHEKMKTKLPALANEYGSKKKKSGTAPIQTTILPMSWEGFFKKVLDDPFHGAELRLNLLQEIRQAFVSVEHFSDMNIEVRKAIGGYESAQIANARWFGSMKGAGYFAQAINENSPHISAALDFIPLNGEVTKKHYLNFIDNFKKAFPNGGDGIAVASRLLAMKRPDYFLCLDKRNVEGVCNDFDLAKSSINYETYWEGLLQRIYNSVWWLSEYPEAEQEQRVWRARTAMLDAIFYKED